MKCTFFLCEGYIANMVKVNSRESLPLFSNLNNIHLYMTNIYSKTENIPLKRNKTSKPQSGRFAYRVLQLLPNEQHLDGQTGPLYSLRTKSLFSVFLYSQL